MTARRLAYRWTVLVRDTEMPGLLDMLRYDGATVLSWDRVESGVGRLDGAYSVTLTGRTFTPDRWHSFGIPTSEPISA